MELVTLTWILYWIVWRGQQVLWIMYLIDYLYVKHPVLIYVWIGAFILYLITGICMEFLHTYYAYNIYALNSAHINRAICYVMDILSKNWCPFTVYLLFLVNALARSVVRAFTHHIFEIVGGWCSLRSEGIVYVRAT